MNGKAHSLSRQSDFRRLQRKGRAWSDRLLVVRTAANFTPSSRFAFSVGKNVGKAVVRNRVKRRLREILRDVPVKQGWDVLIIVRPEVARMQFREVRTGLIKLLQRAGLLE